jgi:amino acid adenylation domain-containing protein
LRFRAPKGVMTRALREELSARRTEIVGALSAELCESPPLTSAQRRIWFLTRLDPESPAYNTFRALRLRGALNLRALEGAATMVVRRHAILRTRCWEQAGQPLQRVEKAMPVRVPVTDLCGMGAARFDSESLRLAIEEARKPLPLTHAPLLRLRILRRSELDHVLLLTTHHFCADGWSVRGVLLPEIADAYRVIVSGLCSKLDELSLRFVDLALLEGEQVRGGGCQSHIAYWRRQLAAAPAAIDLPTDRPRPAVRSARGASVPVVMSASLSDALRQSSRLGEVTLFTLLLAAFQILLYRYSGQRDIVVGTAVSNRSEAATERLIGPISNELVLRTNVEPELSFRAFLVRVRTTVAKGLAHQDLPFDRLVQELHPERDLARNPLFQVMFVVHHFAEAALDLPGIEASSIPIDPGTSRFDLCLEITDADGPLHGSLEYSTELFERPTIERMLAHYQRLLEAVVVSPDAALGSIPLLEDAERKRMLVEWNSTRRAMPRKATVHQLVEERARGVPWRVAVIHAEGKISYGDLNRRADALAASLRAHTLGKDVVVGLFVDRSVEMIVGALGILKAGAAFLPLDPAYPRDRLQLMLGDSRVKVIVTRRSLTASLPPVAARIVEIDAENPGTPNADCMPSRGADADADALAYVIYTSGSTGEPKGVAVTHASVVNLLCWANSAFGGNEKTVVLAATSMSFDLAVFELFYPLSCGGRIVISENLLDWPDHVKLAGVTLINTVPSVLSASLTAGHALPSSADTVLLAGEPISQGLLDQLAKTAAATRVFNLYGPSEATIYATAERIEFDDPRGTIIGRPIDNTRIYVVDESGCPVPIGVRGEIWIGGQGLARGYLHRGRLSAERFIADPFSDEAGSRVYRTGDLGRYLADGRLEFLGRRDRQVKLRGFRIELSEIEAALARHPTISDVAVEVAGQDDIDRHLVAYYTPRADAHVAVSDLRFFAQAHLPRYMVPSAFHCVDSLPRLPSGKLDRSHLAQAGESRPAQADAPSRSGNNLERRIASIWSQVLGRDVRTTTGNFFDLGGHSFLLVVVRQKLRDELGCDVSVVDLFTYPTVESLAARLERAIGEHP